MRIIFSADLEAVIAGERLAYGLRGSGCARWLAILLEGVIPGDDQSRFCNEIAVAHD